MSNNTDNEDKRQKYCPRLGHQVEFSYCRTPGSPQPCRRLVGCWEDTFDAQTFVDEHYSPEQIAQMKAPPDDKMLTLVELIEQAKKSQVEPTE